MNNFTLKIWDDTLSRVTYYSVQYDNSDRTEIDKFYDKFEDDTQVQEEFNQLNTLLLEKIGDERGADIGLFNRQENDVSALPPVGRIAHELEFGGKDFPLRLYCLRLTDEIVVLFNGGIKSSQTAQESPGVSLRMKEANICARIILKEWNRRAILPDDTGRKIVNEDGTDDLYF